MTACAHIYPLTQWICIEPSYLSPKAFGYCFENERSVALSFLLIALMCFATHSSCDTSFCPAKLLHMFFLRHAFMRRPASFWTLLSLSCFNNANRTVNDFEFSNPFEILNFLHFSKVAIPVMSLSISAMLALRAQGAEPPAARL